MISYRCVLAATESNVWPWACGARWPGWLTFIAGGVTQLPMHRWFDWQPVTVCPRTHDSLLKNTHLHNVQFTYTLKPVVHSIHCCRCLLVCYNHRRRRRVIIIIISSSRSELFRLQYYWRKISSVIQPDARFLCDSCTLSLMYLGIQII